MPRIRVDLCGQTFSRLTVVKCVGRRYHDTFWECRCLCGRVTEVAQQKLKSGTTKSCRCWNTDRARQQLTTHGGVKTREYSSWQGAKNRCRNPKSPKYKAYGGRGIMMVEPWRSDFSAFLRDMGPCPKWHSLDRIDNDGPYAPKNCRWATPRQQSNNTRMNRIIVFNGQTRTLSEWAHTVGLPAPVLSLRLSRHKWSIERALTQPLRRR